MKKNMTLWLLVAAFAVLLVGASVLYQSLGDNYRPQQLALEGTGETVPAQSRPAQTESSADEKFYAPDFTAVDGDGNEVKLSDYLGKPVVLNFWASWCGPCKMEMPEFDEAYLELGEDVQFLMVNLTDGSQETVESAGAFVEEAGYSFPVLYDTAMEGAAAYGVSGIPATYLIDAEGCLQGRAVGAIDGETLRYGISLITGE